MDYNDYLRLVFIPIIKAYSRLGNNDNAIVSYHVSKISDHACYALEDQGVLYASKAAQAEYAKHNNGMIHDRKHKEQLAFDTAASKYGRAYGTFHFEHVFTNSMLKRLVAKSDFKFDTVKSIIQRNFCVAWILKSENKLLPKSNRGDTLKDALKIYREKGIILIDSKRKIIN